MRYLRTMVIVSILLCPASASALVNINSATKAQLMDQVDGIGETTANRIIEYRNTQGAIGDLSTLCSLRGVSLNTQTCQKLGALVEFGPLSTVASVSKDEEEESSSSKSREEKEEDERYPVNSLRLTAPKTAYVNQPIDFEVEPAGGRNDRLVRYLWNFGDGATANTATVRHAYKYPGTYVVVVESSYLKEEKMARQEIEVLPVEVSLKTNADGTVTIKNEGSAELDLSGMRLKGGGEFVFPKHSHLKSGKSLTVGLPNSAFSSAALFDQSGAMVTTKVSAAPKTVVTPAPRKTNNTVPEEKPEEVASTFLGPV